MQRAILILWPSFLIAIVANGIFFSLVDPLELRVWGGHLEISRIAAYTTGFFCFWLFAAASSALTCFLQQSNDRVNYSTLE